MRSINEVVSKKLQVIPLSNGEIKVFTLCRAGAYNPNTKKPSIPQGHGLPGLAMIKDPYDNIVRDKLIMNITGFLPVSKPGEKTMFSPITERVLFDSTGSIIVTSEQQNLYAFLKLHPKNRDSPCRDSSKEAVFYEVNEVRDAKVAKNQFMHKILAGNVLNSLEYADLLKLSAKINTDATLGVKIDLNKEESVLLQKLAYVIEQNPTRFIELSENERANIYLKVEALTGEGHILFDEKKRDYFWSEEFGKAAICKIEKGNKPLDGLCDYLISVDGSKALTELNSNYEQAYSVVG